MVRSLPPRRSDPGLYRRGSVLLGKLFFLLLAIWLISKNVTWRDYVHFQDGTKGYVLGRTTDEIQVQVNGSSIITVHAHQVASIKVGLRSLMREISATAWGIVLVVPMCASILFWLRWHMLLRWNGAAVHWSWSGGAWIRSQIAGLLPVGSIGADSYRIYAVRHAFPSLATPMGIGAIERLTGLAALIAIGTAGLFLKGNSSAMPYAGNILLYSGAGICLVGAVVWAIEIWFPRLESRFPNLCNHVFAAIGPLKTMLRSPRRLLCTVSLSLFGQSASVLAFVVIDWIMGWNTDPACYFIAIPAVTLAQMLPLQVAGLGVVELGVWFFLGRWTSRSAADAVIIANMGRLATWMSFAGLGALFWSVRMVWSSDREGGPHGRDIPATPLPRACPTAAGISRV